MVALYTVPTTQNQNDQTPPNHFGSHSSMDSRTSEYQQSASLSTPTSYQTYATTTSPPDHLPQTLEGQADPSQHHEAPQPPEPQDSKRQDQQQPSNAPEVRPIFSSSGTPTSDSATLYPNRTPTFEHSQIGAARHVDGPNRCQPAGTPTATMARNVSASNSPPVKSDPDLTQDSAVPAASPSFSSPGHYGTQYPLGSHSMSEGYQHASTPNQAWRQDWSPYGPSPHQMSTSPYGHSPSPTTMAGAPAMVSTARPVQAQKANRKRVGVPSTNHPLSQVYSFVPIPGASQTKRPRRRYEEIERMYKCGWNCCEKAYGTLNHLNAHVTMQGHGAKRTPDEFKEIRKEWKARKKEEETQRKTQEEEARRRAQDQSGSPSNPDPQASSSTSTFSSGGMGPQQRQLPPPLTYQPSASMPSNGVHYSPSSAPTAPMEHMQQYAQQPIYAGYAAPAQYSGQPQQIFAAQNRGVSSPSNGNNGATAGSEKT